MLVVGLALGLLSLASCTPPPNPFKSTQGGAATLGSSSSYGSSSYGSGSYAATGSSSSYAGGGAASSSGTQYHFAADAPVSSAESEALTRYLHTHRLPMVGGRVLANDGTGTRKAILYGFVATPFGKQDAVAKTRRFLNDSGAEIDNRIMIKPELAASGSGGSSGSTSSSSNDVKRYEEQQRLAEQQQQQQQYMAQQYQSQPSGLLMLLPLLGLFGSGSFGGGSSSFGFGGGAVGPYGGFGGYPGPPPSYGYPPSAYPPSYAPPPYGPSYP